MILDGSGGGLLIGDYVDISAGVHIYTHNTVNRAISGGVAGVEYVRLIGSRVYIGPQSVVEKGIAIGDGVVIGAMSLVNRDVPSDLRVWGIPGLFQDKKTGTRSVGLYLRRAPPCLMLEGGEDIGV